SSAIPPSCNFFLRRKRNRGNPARTPSLTRNSRRGLPGEPEPQFQRTAATVEDELVHELRRRYENVARVQGVRIGVLVDGAIVGRQANAVVLMVERVEGPEAELHRGALRELYGFEQRHVPNVESGGVRRVPPGVRQSPQSGL